MQQHYRTVLRIAKDLTWAMDDLDNLAHAAECLGLLDLANKIAAIIADIDVAESTLSDSIIQCIDRMCHESREQVYLTLNDLIKVAAGDTSENEPLGEDEFAEA